MTLRNNSCSNRLLVTYWQWCSWFSHVQLQCKYSPRSWSPWGARMSPLLGKWIQCICQSKSLQLWREKNQFHVTTPVTCTVNRNTYSSPPHTDNFFLRENKKLHWPPLSSWDRTAERNLGEIHPLQVPTRLNNLGFPPAVSQKLSTAHGQACPERINPSCLKCNSTADRRAQTSPRSCVLCHANPAHSDLAKKRSVLIPNSTAVPPKLTARLLSCSHSHMTNYRTVMSVLPPDLRSTTEQPPSSLSDR